MLETALSPGFCHVKDNGFSTRLSCYRQWCFHGTVMIETVVPPGDCHVRDSNVFIGLPCERQWCLLGTSCWR